MNNNINRPQGEDQGIVKKPNVFYILAFITALVMLAMYGLNNLSDDYKDDLEQMKKSFIEGFNEEYNTTTTATYTTTTTEAIDPNLPEGTQNALRKAYSYLRYGTFSKEGLKKQLLFEKFTEEEAEYAVNNCNGNWVENAVKQSKLYLKLKKYAEDDLRRLLKYDKYTEEEINEAISILRTDNLID